METIPFGVPLEGTRAVCWICVLSPRQGKPVAHPKASAFSLIQARKDTHYLSLISGMT